MAKWSKPSPGLTDLFHESLPEDGRVILRRMFGLPCAFVNGNIAAGVFEDGLFARLPAETWTRLEEELGATGFEPRPGRPSRTYLMLPDDIVADDQQLAEILAEAVAFTDSLPVKVPGKSTRKAKAARAPEGLS